MKITRKIEGKIKNLLQDNCVYNTCVLCNKEPVFLYKIRDRLEVISEIKYSRIFYAGYCSEHDKEYEDKTKESIIRKLLLDVPAHFICEYDF